MNYHTGKLSGRLISASGRCIIYDHKREDIYLSSATRSLIASAGESQQNRDSGGAYRVYRRR